MTSCGGEYPQGTRYCPQDGRELQSRAGPPETVTRPLRGLAETRFCRLYMGPGQGQTWVDDLLLVVQRVAQELETLKAMLEKKGVWDEALYRRLHTQRMIDDHSSAGASPETRWSLFKYTLDDEQFLSAVFGATPSELEDFQRKVRYVRTLT